MKRLALFIVLVVLLLSLNMQEASAASKSLLNATAKVDHLTWSLKNNYLGIKNQAQWEEYIKGAKILISYIPNNENTKKNELNIRLSKAESLVKSIARINHVEKSMDINYHGIKNASQWKEYTRLGEEELLKVDKKEFINEYNNLISRLEKCKETISFIEGEFNKEYTSALNIYINARKTMFIKDGETALEAAKNLGTCELSKELINKCEKLINEIKTLKIEIESVTIDENTYDDDTKNQYITLRVNGDIISLDFLHAAGYNIEFSAKDNKGNKVDIFEEDNYRGKLKSRLNKGEYYITATLTKDNNIYSSEATRIQVINLDINATSIEGYSIKNLGESGVEGRGSFVQSSNTLVVGEKAYINSINVLIDNTINRISNDIKITSNSDTISINNGIITAIKKGKATITILYNGISKDMYINIENEKRKISTIESDNRVESIVNKNTSILIYTKDQYGDLIKYSDLITSIQSGYGIVESVHTEYSEKIGKVKINIKTGSLSGQAALHLKDKEGNLLKTIYIYVTKIDNVETTKLSIVKSKNSIYSDDELIYTEDANKDKYVKFQLLQYTSEGLYNGQTNLKGYSIKYDEKTLTITNQENGIFIDSNEFIVSGKKEGASDIVIYSSNGNLIAKTRIKVVSDKNSIESILWKDYDNINYIGEKINIYKALDIIQSSNDDIVNGLTLKDTTLKKVRIKKSQYTKDSTINSGELYIDQNGNGLYDEGEQVLGKISGKIIDLSFKSVVKDMNIFNGITTKRGDKLIIIFTLEDSDKNIKDTKNINVNVK